MVYGEVFKLKEAYDIFFYLFMDKKDRTEVMGKQLGGVLGMFQELLQDELLLSIARLTDKDNKYQKQVSLWALLAANTHSRNESFPQDVTDALNKIWIKAANIREHRHKRIAHFDQKASLDESRLPLVMLTEIAAVIADIADYLNMYAREFDETTIFFDLVSSRQITHPAEVASYKALAYDFFEKSGVIPRNEWRKHFTKKAANG